MKSDRLLFLLMLCLTFNACEKSQDEDRPQAGQGVYVLNNGNMGDNDADIGIYSPSSKTFVSDVFFSVNGQKLGDLGQDILTFNDEVYIAVNGSRTIFVTDLSLKIKEQEKVGHYHVFHTILDFLGISSPVYDENLNIFE